MNRSKRDLRIIESALSGLLEYHESLCDDVFVAELTASVKVPDTGNDQADYESVKQHIERQCERLEAAQEDRDRRRGLYGPEYAGETF